MDGRVQSSITKYLMKKFHVSYIDQITEAGPLKYLANDQKNTVMQDIVNRIDVSVNKHHSKGIAIVGHEDCAGNPCNEKI